MKRGICIIPLVVALLLPVSSKARLTNPLLAV